MNNSDLTSLLAEIFPQKPEPVSSELPAGFVSVIEAARAAGLREIPTIVIESNPVNFTGRLDFSTYSETTIRIASLFQPVDGWVIERSEAQQIKSLAHELGHVHHFQEFGGGYEKLGFAFCEDYADQFKDRILGA